MSKRLLEFFSLLEDDLATIQPSEGYQAFAVARQRERAKKRARLGDSSLKAKAIEEFISLNREVGASGVSLPADIINEAREYIRMALERYSATASELNIQVTLDRVHLLDLWRFGPGASFDTVGTHAAEKICQPWSTTSLAVPEVNRLRHNHPYLSARDSTQGGIVVVEGAELNTVPKNEEKDRTTTKEPLGNMCMQLAAGAYFEGALRCVGLDIRDQQPKNQAMACFGSLTGTRATMDLKSASDRELPALVRLLLPPEWFELLWRIRSPKARLPNGEWITLEMISTMGNGFTFPLMTMLIVSLLYAYRRVRRGGPRLWIDWTTACVFGDDIILPTDEYHDFAEILHQSGYVVNHDKSYFEGPFRESCGGDYWLGRDVTPFYVRSLDSDAEIYVALNKMSEWAAKVGVRPMRALEFLFSELEHALCFVPEWDADTAGFRCTQVDRHYRKHHPVVLRRTLRDQTFLMPLACAGYVVSSPNGPLYMPRTVKVRYRIVRSRLPRGYLDGRDPGFRDSSVSSYCDFVAWLGSVVFHKAA
jgi:hypothetical protein